jgi:hypothetical protein
MWGELNRKDSPFVFYLFNPFGFCFLKLELEDLKAPKISMGERIHVWNIFLESYQIFPGNFCLTNPKELSAVWFLGFACFSLLLISPSCFVESLSLSLSCVNQISLIFIGFVVVMYKVRDFVSSLILY